jgi:regulatory protein
MPIKRSDFPNRIKKYCAEAERSSFDVRKKLEEWKVPSEEIDDLLKMLEKEKFFDDNRFTKSYVSEKWNLDRWGKIKIQHALQQKNIDEHVIRKSLDDIDEKEYIKGLYEILRIKMREVKSSDLANDAKRTMMYALSKGYEEDLIRDWLDDIIKI